MRVPILMPQLGESIAEATLIKSLIKVGDSVTADQEILEVETNKAILHVTAPAAGKLIELDATPQQVYPVGSVLGYLEVAETAAPVPTINSGIGGSQNGKLPETQPSIREDQALADKGQTQSALLTASAAAVMQKPKSVSTGASKGLISSHELGFFSPRVKNQLAERGLQGVDLSAITGTGAGGRITARDIEEFTNNLDTHSTTQPASAMRLAVADAMKRSWVRPLATVGRYLNLEAVLAHRKQCNDPVPGLTLYVLRALALAIAEDPKRAVRLVGNQVVAPKSIHLGFAVEAENGVMTPVLRDVDKSSLLALAPKYQELVKLAQGRRLGQEATSGAMATVSNFGPFGLNWGTPIPLPDQGFIVGLGAGQRQPLWDEKKEAFIPVVQAEISLTFDHRSMDGAGAGKLLAKIAMLLAEPEKL